MAPVCSGYQPLIRAYVGQGLRRDPERLEATSEVSALVDSLRRQMVQEEVIASALAEVEGAVA